MYKYDFFLVLCMDIVFMSGVSYLRYINMGDLILEDIIYWDLLIFILDNCGVCFVIDRFLIFCFKLFCIVLRVDKFIFFF